MKLEFPLEKQFPLGSGFGPRGSLSGGKIKAHNHKGQDIAAPTGTKVKSVDDGVVVRSSPVAQGGGYGNFIIIKHKDFYSAYGHLSKREVNKGDTVKRGQLIGLVGSTGLSTGPHLHFEIRKSENGSQVDPKPYLTGSELNSTILDKTSSGDKTSSDDTKSPEETDTETKGTEFEGPKPAENTMLKSMLQLIGFKENDESKTKHKKLSESTTNIGGSFTTDLENGPKNHASRPLGNWESDNAWDVFAPAGSVVKSYTNGKVTKVYNNGKNSGKIYGTQVSISGIDGYPKIFYTHLKNVKLKSGDTVKVGDVIGEVSEWLDNMKMTHVHIGLPTGNHLRDLLKSSGKIFKDTSKKTSTDSETKGETKGETDGENDSDDGFEGPKPAENTMLKSMLQLIGFKESDESKEKIKTITEEVSRIKNLMK